MKAIGFILISVGFLIGALAATSNEEVVYWNFFLGALAIGVVGIALVHAAHRRHTHEGGKLAANIETVEASLSRIVDNITKLDAEKHSIYTYEIRHKIDALFLEDVAAFVEARKSIAHAHGLPAYASVMSSFAAGERYLNRVWSASADGYIDEVNEYLDKAKDQFAESLDIVRRFQGSPQVA